MIIADCIEYHKKFVLSTDKQDIIEYITKANELLNLEELRVLSYLPLETINTITNNLKKIIFFDESKTLLELSKIGFNQLLTKMDLQVNIITK